MQYSEKPAIELQLAKDIVTEMSRAQEVRKLEGLWKRYLHHLDRVWNKAEAHYSRSPKWSGWHGKYLNQRRRDELLSYLINARNADEHSIEEITKRDMGSFSIRPIEEGGEVHIDSLIVGADGEVTELITPSRVIVESKLARVRLLPVTNRGREYPPPTRHLGKPIDPNNLLATALAGAAFYESFLADAVAYFVRPEK